MDLQDFLTDEDGDELLDEVLYSEYWYLMRISCIYPKWKSGVSKVFTVIYGLIMAFVMIYTFMICIWTTIIAKDDLLVASQSLHFCFLEVVSLIIIITGCFLRKYFATIHKAIGKGISNYDEQTVRGADSMNRSFRKKKKILLFLISVYIVSTGITGTLLRPFLNNIFSDSVPEIYSPNGVSNNLPLPLWTPFGSHTTIGYVLSALMEVICGSQIVVVIASADLVAVVVTQYLTKEMKLLILGLKRLPQRTIQTYKDRRNKGEVLFKQIRENPELIKSCNLCLRESAIHNQNIIFLFHEIKRLISVPIFFAYLFGSIVIAASGVGLIFGKGEIGSMLSAFVLGLTEILNTLLISWCGEQITQANDELIITLYSIKWYYLPKSEAKTILIMMGRAQRPLTLFAGGLVPLNFETFTNVMNSAYSYFNLIYASHQDN